MEYTAPGLETVTHQLNGLDRPRKAKMLVVDDEPDNLDLLYRTFRRDFNVLKAESGVQALEILKAEGEVAVIISDQRMPEMKGTEFLSQTVPEFPDTVRIILTGFTDVEDLVEAINSGQVYKYITKPWDPEELKAVVSRAAETYVLLKQRTAELYRAQQQTALLARLVQIAQDVCELNGSLTETAKAFATTFKADRAALQIVDQGQLSQGGLYKSNDGWLAQDPLVQKALTSGQMQACLDLSQDETLANLPHYTAAGIQAHLVIPIALHNQVTAMLSLQWEKSPQIHEEEIVLLHLAAQQVGVSIAYTRQQSLATV